MNISLVLLGVALLAVLASLGMGLFAMARGREGDAQLSQKMMRLRIVTQAVALVCFILAVMTRG